MNMDTQCRKCPKPVLNKTKKNNFECNKLSIFVSVKEKRRYMQKHTENYSIDNQQV